MEVFQVEVVVAVDYSISHLSEVLSDKFAGEVGVFLSLTKLGDGNEWRKAEFLKGR